MAKIKKDLTQGSVVKNLILFSFPLFLSYLLQALYGSADTIIVGRYASLGDITGVTQGSQVMYILTNTISGISTGGSVLISQYLGAKKEKELNDTVSTLFTMFIYSALGFTVLLLLTNGLIINILEIQPEAVLPMKQYLCVCEIGTLFIFLYNCISAVLQAMGDSKHPLVFVGIACVVNIALDLVLVAGLNMGAFGAAIATVFAQFLSVVMSVIFLRKQNFSFDFRISNLKIDSTQARKILRLGLPYAIQRVCVSISFLAISGLSNPYGLAAGAAAGVVNKINNFVTLPYTAIQVAISAMTGQNMGAGNEKRAVKSLWTGVSICFGIGVLMFTLAHICPEFMLSVFSKDPEMLAVGKDFLKAYSFEYLTMAFTWTIHGFMSACGHTLIPSIDGLLASVVFRIPLAILFSRKLGMGFKGIAFGSAMAVWGAFIPAFIFYFSGVWRKDVINK